ncbi:MAG TPA: TolC family protein [Thermoanaerobaculia bacterium]|nr:TolC family protein [Thermoanaerobaculia bacterium]
MTTHRLRNFLSGALLAVAAGAPVLGQSPLQSSGAARATFTDRGLEDLVSEALAKNPDIAASAATAEAAGFRIAPARTLPDPFLALNYQNDGWAFSLGVQDMTFLGLVFAQPLPWPGKLRLAGEEAAFRAEEVKAGTVGRTRLAVEARVRRAYYEYLLARSLLDLIEDRSRAWREISTITRERYAVGLGVQQDVLRAQVEVLRLDEARADQTAQVANRRTELNRVVGRPQDAPLDTDQHLEYRPDVPALDALLIAVRDRSPELAAASHGIEADRSRVELAKKDLLPDFVASGGPMYRGGLDPMWQVGLGITLPIYAGSRQKPRLEAAKAELHSDESLYSSAALELEFRTRERFRNLDAALRVARLYREGVLPTDELSLESAVASYRTGKVPFVTVLEALTTLYADRATYLGRLGDAEKWRVAIDEAELQPSASMTAVGPAVATSKGSIMGSTSAAVGMSSSPSMR